MTSPAASRPPAGDIHAVEELLRTLGKSQRALQMYLPNNPVYQRALQQVCDGFGPVWQATSRLELDIHEDRITWDDVAVFQQPAKSEGLAWQLYKDGLRRLVLAPGVETEEVVRLLQVINRARMLPADATDDLLTLLWEQEFLHVSYTFIEALGEGMEFLQERGANLGGGSGSGSGGSGNGGARAEVSAARGAPDGTEEAAGGGHGLVDLADFDSKPYFLDEAEVRLLHNALDEEYSRDIRQAAIDALLDVLETQRSADVRREAIALLDFILPTQLSVGGFRAVARLLRELRVIASRAEGLDAELHQALLAFEERLSTPEILDQLFRVLHDTAARPHDEDVGEVLRELKPTALPAVLHQLSRAPDAAVRRVLEASVEALARSQPDALGELIAHDDAVVIPAIGAAARLGLGQLVPAIITRLQSADDAIRLASARALGELATPTAIVALESALDDPERGVRQLALSLLMARGGSGGVGAHLEALLFGAEERDYERSERRTLFEAYGTIAGGAAVDRLRELAEPRGFMRRKVSPDVRASALYALGKVRTSEARSVVQLFTADKEPVVRSAANAVLRDWPL